MVSRGLGANPDCPAYFRGASARPAYSAQGIVDTVAEGLRNLHLPLDKPNHYTQVPALPTAAAAHARPSSAPPTAATAATAITPAIATATATAGGAADGAHHPMRGPASGHRGQHAPNRTTPGSALGVSLSALKEIARHVPKSWSLEQVADRLVHPLTQGHPGKSLAEVPGLLGARYKGPPDIWVLASPSSLLTDVVGVLEGEVAQGWEQCTYRRGDGPLGGLLDPGPPGSARAEGPFFYLEALCANAHQLSEDDKLDHVRGVAALAKRVRQAWVLLNTGFSETDAAALQVATTEVTERVLDSDGVAGFEVASRKVVAGGGGRAGAPLPRLPPCRDVTQQLATLHAIWAVHYHQAGASRGRCDVTSPVHFITQLPPSLQGRDDCQPHSRHAAAPLQRLHAACGKGVRRRCPPKCCEGGQPVAGAKLPVPLPARASLPYLQTAHPGREGEAQRERVVGAIKSVVGPDLAVANSGIRQCLKAAALRLESHVFRELWEGDMTLVMERVHQEWLDEGDTAAAVSYMRMATNRSKNKDLLSLLLDHGLHTLVWAALGDYTSPDTQLEAATVLEGLVGGASEHTVRAMEPAGLTGNLVKLVENRGAVPVRTRYVILNHVIYSLANIMNDAVGWRAEALRCGLNRAVHGLLMEVLTHPSRTVPPDLMALMHLYRGDLAPPAVQQTPGSTVPAVQGMAAQRPLTPPTSHLHTWPPPVEAERSMLEAERSSSGAERSSPASIPTPEQWLALGRLLVHPLRVDHSYCVGPQGGDGVGLGGAGGPGSGAIPPEAHPPDPSVLDLHLLSSLISLYHTLFASEKLPAMPAEAQEGALGVALPLAAAALAWQEAATAGKPGTPVLRDVDRRRLREACDDGSDLMRALLDMPLPPPQADGEPFQPAQLLLKGGGLGLLAHVLELGFGHHAVPAKAVIGACQALGSAAKQLEGHEQGGEVLRQLLLGRDARLAGQLVDVLWLTSTNAQLEDNDWRLPLAKRDHGPVKQMHVGVGQTLVAAAKACKRPADRLLLANRTLPMLQRVLTSAYFGGQVVIGLKAAAAEMCGVLLAGQPFPKPPPLGATPPNSCWGELEDGAGPVDVAVLRSVVTCGLAAGLASVLVEWQSAPQEFSPEAAAHQVYAVCVLRAMVRGVRDAGDPALTSALFKQMVDHPQDVSATAASVRVESVGGGTGPLTITAGGYVGAYYSQTQAGSSPQQPAPSSLRGVFACDGCAAKRLLMLSDESRSPVQAHALQLCQMLREWRGAGDGHGNDSPQLSC